MFNLNINNFRCFDNQNFDFSRINILIGENSGGKSSLIKFLLALKQTLETPNISSLILCGDHTDLGNYKEIINNHDENKEIGFSFSFKDELGDYFKYFFLGGLDEEDPKRNRIVGYIKKALQYETYVNFQLNKNLDVHNSIKTTFYNEYLGSLSIVFNDYSDKDIEEYDIVPDSKKCLLLYKNKLRNKEYIIDEIEYEEKGFLTIIDGNSLKKKCIDKFKSKKLFYELSVFLLNQNLIEYYIHNTRYLNPLGSKPERFYFRKDNQSQYLKSDLEKFTNHINNNRISQKDLKKFGEILKNFGIADGIQIISPKNFPVSELRVKIKELFSNISDVGYGVALQIPILFESFLAESLFGATFLIEQPEVHLHPKLQAKFIETLLSLGEQNTYIIETHSEYIVRMLQIIIKNKTFNVTNEDVRIYYFARGKDKFEISKHSIDENGRMLTEFPSGFYDNSYKLTKSLLF